MNACGRLIRLAVLTSCLAVAGLGLWNLGDGATANAQNKKERHPHIRASLVELKEARKELKEADHDFGGHRVKSIEAIDRAIEQLEKCLKFDKR